MASYARKIKRQAMDEDKLKAIIQAEMHSATGSLLGSDGGGDLADQRRKSMDYYLSQPFGNEVDGRSQVIDSVVHDVVEAALPDLLELFTASDEIVRFNPEQPGDEDAAKQATEYVNFIFHRDNDGFRILHWWFKDALLQKNGILKVFWEETDEKKRHTFTGLLEDEVNLILNEEGVEPVEHEVDKDTGLHALTILRDNPQGRVRIMPVPPEEFLIARRAVTLEDASFVAHRVRKTISELIEEGYDPEVLERIPSHDESEYNEERLARFNADDEWPVDAYGLDPAMRTVWITECYIKTDWDGDGVAELRKITVAGTGYEILDNEAIDDTPFVDITPIPMPHKFFGMSLADECMDITEIKSTILRQLLDNMYFANNHRTAVNERVNLDDLLTNRPGGVVRIEGHAPIGDAFHEMQTNTIGNFAYPLLEYMDTIRESRTGITRYNQGMDADSLNKTAAGINMITQAANKRKQLIGRIFAETGVKVVMRKILRLVINHQDKPRMIRLRDEWVPMDPRSWNAEMDVSIDVGLGFGTQESKMFAMQRLMEMQQQIVMGQGGVNGPLITWQEIHNSGAKFLEAMQEKNIDQFIKNPEDATDEEKQAQAQPQPNPEAEAAQMEAQMKQGEMQAKMQAEQGKMQIEGAKMQQADQHFQSEMELKWAEAQAKHGIEGQKLGLDGQKLQLEGQRVVQDGQMKGEEQDMKREDLTQRRQENVINQLDRLSGGSILKDLDETHKMADSASQGLEQFGKALQDIADSIAQIDERMQAPKSVTPVRKGGKIVGAKVTQGDITTDVSIN